MKRKKYKRYVAYACVIIFVCYFFGVGDYVFSKSFEREFDYPLNINTRHVVQELMTGKTPNVTAINNYPYKFLTYSNKCKDVEKLDLFIAVKSARQNFGHRLAIRQTYGQENVLPGRIVRALFFLGVHESHDSEDTQKRIDEETARFKDVIQIDFHDNYYNNTIKTMMSFRWLYEHCSIADYYLFTDDDMYINVNNLLNYAEDQITPTMDEHLEDYIDSSRKKSERDIRNAIPTGFITKNGKSEKDKELFAGYVFKSAPLRYRTSKWRVSLDEYPWNKWPPYVTAGAYIVSNRSMKILYLGSLYVKHFRFDDIYLGIVAKKVGIQPKHCSQFHFYKKKYSKEGYKYVIASHGYNDHDELIKVWNEQNKIM